MDGNRIIRRSTATVVVGIGAVAAYVSYRHAYELATGYGETGLTARLLPLTIDGLVYVASMVMLDAARRKLETPALARFSLGLGILATLAANVIHGLTHGPVGAVVSAWPAVALVLTVEMAMGMIRRNAVVPVAEDAPEPTAEPLVSLARETFATALDSGSVPSIRKIMNEIHVGYPKAARIKAALAEGI